MTTIEKSLYHQPGLDIFLEKELSEIQYHVKMNSESYAIRNLPPLANENLRSFFQEDHQPFQTLVHTVGAKLQCKTLYNQVFEDDKLTKSQVETLHNKLTAVRQAQISIDKSLNGKTPPYSRYRIPLVWSAICTISLFEGFLAMPVFETWGFPFIHSCLLSMLFAGALAVFSHCFEHIVALGKTTWQRRGIAAMLLLLLIALFTFMSITRAENLSQQVSSDTGGVIHFSPIPYILTSVLLFIVAVALNHFFFPQKAERAEMRAYRKLHHDKLLNLEEQDRLAAEIEAVKARNAELRKTNASMLEYGCKLEEMVISHAYAAFALWKKHNTMHRPDNGQPLSFADHQYPFPFETSFHTIKSVQQ